MESEILQLYNKLHSLSLNSSAQEKRNRGREFEQLLRKILESDNLLPETNIRPDGEEIDGSFILGDRVFLLEAKWHKDPLTASSIYAFKGKVDGKLTGTIGVFISMSGFSTDAVDALSLGKSLNVILFDKNDIEASLESDSSFKKVLQLKLRKAAERGIVYYPIKSTKLILDKGTGIGESEEIDTNEISTKEKIIFICEGQSDAIILEALVKRIAGEQALKNKELVIVAANGKNQVPKLGKDLTRLIENEDKIIYIIDGDHEIEQTKELFNIHGISLNNVIIPNPSIEIWLGMGENQSHHEFYRENRLKRNDKINMFRLVSSIDLEELRIANEEFRKFEELIVEKNTKA